MAIGGEAGIRTLGTLTGTPHFECGAFDHSATSPQRRGCRKRRPGKVKGGPIAKAERLAKRHALVSRGKTTKLQFMNTQISRPASEKLPPVAHARFDIGDVVRHRHFEFRGVIFDVDPVFANSEEWYESIPEDIRPSKDQPFYHLLAENADSNYIAYVSQQNLVVDDSEEPVDHPAISGIFEGFDGLRYQLKSTHRH